MLSALAFQRQNLHLLLLIRARMQRKWLALDLQGQTVHGHPVRSRRTTCKDLQSLQGALVCKVGSHKTYKTTNIHKPTRSDLRSLGKTIWMDTQSISSGLLAPNCIPTLKKPESSTTLQKMPKKRPSL